MNRFPLARGGDKILRSKLPCIYSRAPVLQPRLVRLPKYATMSGWPQKHYEDPTEARARKVLKRSFQGPHPFRH